MAEKVAEAYSYISQYIEYQKRMLASQILGVEFPTAKHTFRGVEPPRAKRIDWDELAPSVLDTCVSNEEVDLGTVSICLRDGEFVCLSKEQMTEEERDRISRAEFMEDFDTDSEE